MHILTFWNISCGAFLAKPIILGLVDEGSFENEVFADIPLYDLKLGTQTTFTALAHTYLNPQGWVPHWLPQGSQPEPKNYLKYHGNMTIFLSLFAKWLISQCTTEPFQIWAFLPDCDCAKELDVSGIGMDYDHPIEVTRSPHE